MAISTQSDSCADLFNARARAAPRNFPIDRSNLQKPASFIEMDEENSMETGRSWRQSQYASRRADINAIDFPPFA
jgi:hypothetical protein